MSRRWTAVLIALLALPACGDQTGSPRTNPTGLPVSPSVTASPSVTGTPPAGTPSATVTPPGTMRVPVYYLGGTQQRPVLFREFRSVARTASVAFAAVDAMLHLAPTDSDYYSLWPSKTVVRGVAISGTTATVDLSGAARSVTTTRAHEQASVQQLVHTVTAAAPNVKGVRLRFDGQSKPTLWGRVDTTRTISRAPHIDTLAPIWVVSPAQGAKVGTRFTVTGTASVFEATVSWAVTRPGSTAHIVDGFVTASEGAPGRGDFSIDVRLPAGTTGDVVFTAWESSAEDGRPLHPDSKTYRVT